MFSLTRITSVKTNIVANYLGKGWEAAMGLAFVPLYIAYLGPEAFGLVGLVAIIQAFMGILDLGMTPTLTRETARYEAKAFDTTHMRDLLRSIEIVTLVVSLVIFLSVALTSPLIADYWVQNETLSSGTIANALSIAAAVIAMRFFETIYRGSLYGLQRQVLANVIAAIMATVRGGGAVILLVFFEADLITFFSWQAIVSLLTILALRSSVYLIIPPASRSGRFSFASLSSVWRFALGMLAISLLSILATQGDKLILSSLIGLEEFGYYVFSAKVASVILIVSGPILSAVYPQLVGHVGQNDEPQLIVKFHQYAKIVVCITAPMAAVLSFFAEPVVFVWSGDQSLAASTAPLLSVIVLGVFLHTQCVLPYQIQLAYGWTSLAVWTNLIAVLLLATSIFFIVPKYGAVGAAWVWVTVASLYFFGSTNVTFFRYIKKERLYFYFQDIALPSCVSFSAAYAAKLIVLELDLSRIAMSFYIISTLGIVWGLAIITIFLSKSAFQMRPRNL